MKRKLLFAAMTLIAGAWSLGAHAQQQDVTSTYLTNADFESSAALTTNLKGYGKDGSPYGFQAVDGWTSVVTNGDNGNAAYPNSGMGAAVFAYGSTNQMQGNNKSAPANGPESSSTKCLGFFAVWGCGGYYYQTVTFPAGEYTINIPVYNQSGTNGTTTYFGFYPNSGTSQPMNTPTSTGSWVTLTKTFTLAAETTGQIRIGYKSNGSGSGANPHLFIDKVQILYTPVVIKDGLEASIAYATRVNATLGTLASAISTAQGVYDSASASQADVEGAAATLNAAVADAIKNSGLTNLNFVLQNADFSSTDGWTPVVSDQFKDYGNGLIGTSLASYTASTTDETHLNTEYYLATECRWNTNFVYFTQSALILPEGNYSLSFDVENTNANTTAATNYENHFTVTAGGTTFTDEKTEWMSGATSWTTHTVNFSLSAPSAVDISLGYGTGVNNFGSANTPVLYISHLALQTVSDAEVLAAAKAAWEAAWQAADDASNDGLYDNVSGKDRGDLNAELLKAEPTTVTGYEEATAALIAATTTFTGAVAYWDALDREIGKASALGVSPQDAENVFNDTNATAADALAATQTLKVDEYNYVTGTYKYGVELGTWTKTGPTGSLDSQHWSDTTHEYLEQSSAAWGQNSWSIEYDQDISLPAGNYIFKVAGRKAPGDGVTLNLVVKNGDTVLGTVNDFPEGDTGYGIDTTGATNFDASASYANGNAGRGWEWRYVKFSLSETTTVNIAVTAEATVQYMWVSFCDATVNTDNEAGFALIEYNVALGNAQTAIANTDYSNVSGKELTDLSAAIAADATLDKTNKTAIEAAIQTLNDAVTAFTAAKATYDAFEALTKREKITGNIGDDPFQYNEVTNNAAYATYEDAFNAVVVDPATTTAADLQLLLDAEAAAKEAYLNQQLNVCNLGEYNILVATEGHSKLGNAVMALLGATSANNPTGYSFNASTVPTDYLAQTFIFAPVAGEANTYKIFINMAEGTVYLTIGSLNGSAAGWATQQIQGTTDEAAAGKFRIVGTEKDHVFKIVNTVFGDFIDCQDGGSLYTDTDIALDEFTLGEPSKVTMTLALAKDKFATRIFPFPPTNIVNAKLYGVSAIDADGVTLVLVEDVDPKANTPYIVEAAYGDINEALSYYGMGATTSYTAGLLTGVYVPTQAEQGCYVLQTQSGEQKFFPVKSDDITIPAYRAYLKLPDASAGVKEFLNIRFDDGEATGIAVLDALNSGKAVIYDAAGQRQPTLQKGMNILKMQDGSVRKVMVK